MTVSDLVAVNTPQRFWRLAAPVADSAWEQAVAAAATRIAWPFAPPATIGALLEATLGEGQFGPERYALGGARRTYYSLVRPLLPARLRPWLRKAWRARARRTFPLGWPIEDRYVRFQYGVLRAVCAAAGLDEVEMRWFWPGRAQFALCLTHDVEARAGHDFVPAVMDLEERLGFRSCFNFVASDYAVDPSLLREIRARGFEVGVHGYTHNGRLFVSREAFSASARKTNEIARDWQATGFRSPLTHRAPEWMQALEVDYDMSFFDSDPFEPMPGGTMSIWPFALGRFIELPYTLPQDHSLFEMRASPQAVWAEKLRFIRRYHGLALINVHPDYLLDPGRLAIYRGFLEAAAADRVFWHALPREIAARWRTRLDDAGPPDPEDAVRVRIGAGDEEPAFDLAGAPVNADGARARER